MNEKLESKYGLPTNVTFCKKCVVSNQKPISSVEFKHSRKKIHIGIVIGEDDVCDACKYAEIKDKTVDWKEREKELQWLLDIYRKNDGSYDVLVPGSGGKDSALAAHILKYKYRMHPLTCTWPPHIYTDIGWKNFINWINIGGFDNITSWPNGRVHRLLTKLAFENLLHPFQPFIIGQKNIAPQIALKYGIQLIFYGENEAEYHNPIKDNKSPKRDKKYYSKTNINDIILGGVSIQKLIDNYNLNLNDLEMYLPPDEEEIEKAKIDVQYFGYYMKWTPQESYYYAVENTGFNANPERKEGSYTKFASLDDKIDDLHYYTTFIKFGIGRATYEAAKDIRNHHITRDEGITLVHKFDGEFPKKYHNEILEYMDLTEEQFIEIVDSFRSPHLWEKINGEWQLRHKVK